MFPNAIAMEESAEAKVHDAEISEIFTTEESADIMVHTVKESETSAAEESTHPMVRNDQESEVPMSEKNEKETEHNHLQQVATEAPAITKVTSEWQPEDKQGDSPELDLKPVKKTRSTSPPPALHQLMECHLITWQEEDEQEDGPELELKQAKETWDTHELDPFTRQQKDSQEQVVAEMVEALEITSPNRALQYPHLRKAARLQHLPQNIFSEREPPSPEEDPHGRAVAPVQTVLQDLYPVRPVGGPHGDPH